MRTVLVIGLGRFGTNLALKMAELGNEVMVIDSDEDKINRIAPNVTRAQIGDCMAHDVLSSLGVGNFDLCFVCIGEHLQSALEIASELKDLGARHIISKADNELHAKFLLKIGADEVIIPEQDMAFRAAAKYSVENAFDYFEFSSEYVMYELLVPEAWVGRSIREVNVRSRYNVNILGLKKDGRVTPITDAEHKFFAGEHLIVAGGRGDILRLAGQKVKL